MEPIHKIGLIQGLKKHRRTTGGGRNILFQASQVAMFWLLPYDWKSTTQQLYKESAACQCVTQTGHKKPQIKTHHGSIVGPIFGPCQYVEKLVSVACGLAQKTWQGTLITRTHENKTLTSWVPIGCLSRVLLNAHWAPTMMCMFVLHRPTSCAAGKLKTKPTHPN